MRALAKSFVKRQLGPRFELLRPYLLWGKNRVESLTKLSGLYEGSAVVWDAPEHAHCVPVETVGPGRGELFGRTLYSAISAGTEVSFFQRQRNTFATFPSTPGYSLCGEILKVGRGVDNFKPGQLIAVRAAHRSYFCCPADDAFLVPDAVSPQEASLVYIGAIAMHGVWTAEITPADRVCVVGRGIIGQLATQLAHCLGATQIISMARSPARADHGLEAFADETLSGKNDGWTRLASLKPNVIIEASGSVDALSRSLRTVCSGGRIVLLGSYRDTLRGLDLNDCARRCIELRGCHIETLQKSGTEKSYRAAGTQFLDLISQKKINIGAFTKSLVDPNLAGRFYRDLASGKIDDRIALFDWSRLPDQERIKKSAFLNKPDPTYWRAKKMHPAPLFADLSGHEMHLKDRAP